ncbi:dITP/XTP pyrophosphatase [bioreactor metagenome]|uniref:dITP/XTP pyrophosphatase n=1 Tax=bioreactor metagenome TaxID=1076179 RepID=A0A645CZW3_9ZZZZ
MNFIIATHNKKKQTELQRVLKPLGIDVLTADDLNITLTDVDETGSTFQENARLKAVSGCKESGLPCIADDSGLVVDALEGAPGIYSARYAGEHGNDSLNNQKLLQNLADIPPEKRTARFVCAISCIFPDGKEIAVEGTCEGKIAFEPDGMGGFGYDPLFICGGQSFGRLSAEEKDRVSHRGNALRKLVKELEKNHDQ